MASGLKLRITHTGATKGPIYIDDLTIDGIRRGLPEESSYIPEGQTVEITYGGLVPLSFEKGDIRRFINLGYITTRFLTGSEVQKGSVVHVTTPNYNVGVDDGIILTHRATTGVVQLYLPPGGTHGGVLRIVDVKGDASIYNIIIISADGDTINDAGSINLIADHGALDIVYDTDQSDWVVLAYQGSVLTPTVTETRRTSINTTATAGETLLVDPTAGDITVLLPATPFDNSLITVKHIGSANIITIDGNGNTIDGAATIAITVPLDAITMVANTNEWFII